MPALYFLIFLFFGVMLVIPFVVGIFWIIVVTILLVAIGATICYFASKFAASHPAAALRIKRFFACVAGILGGGVVGGVVAAMIYFPLQLLLVVQFSVTTERPLSIIAEAFIVICAILGGLFGLSSVED